MIQRCPGCGREHERDVGLRTGVQLIICPDCDDEGLTPGDFDENGNLIEEKAVTPP